MKYVFNDGGRAKYFKAAKVSDCVVRAIAIATQKDYKDVYDEIADVCGYTPRNGVYKRDAKKVIESLGGKWVSTMRVGSGCKVHLRDGEVPMKGRIICNCSGHVVAVIDGVINDTHDPSRGGTRCVYGYWTFE